MRPNALVLIVSLLLPAALAAVDGSSPVVEVDGEAITLRQLEDELLQREGVERMLDLLEAELAAVEWRRLADDEVIFQLGERRVTRLDAVADLLHRDGHRVRRELINITLVRQALEAEGLDPADLPADVVAAELARWESQLKARAQAQYNAEIDFADALHTFEGKTVEQLVVEDGFRMSAGLHELVLRHTEVEPATLRDHYAEHAEGVFHTPPAVRLQLVRFVYDLGDGKEDQRREILPALVGNMHAAIAAGTRSFAQVWHNHGRSHDPRAEGGDVGWVAITGELLDQSGEPVPRRVTERAFDADLVDGPVLLPPIEHEAGIVLARVLARRPGARPAFDEIAAEVRRHYLEQDLEAHTQRYMALLGERAEVVYDVGEQSFDQLVEERVREAGLRRSAPAEDGASAP